LLKRLFIRSRDLGKAIRCSRSEGLKCRSQRHELMAGDSAGLPRSSLVASLSPRLVPLVELRAKLRVRQFEGRPNPDAAPRGDPAKAASPRPADQPQEHGLGLVVSRVRRRDPVSPTGGLDSLQKLPTRVARGYFDGQTLLTSERRHIHPFGDDGHAKLAGQSPTERLVRIRCFAANLMIEMGRAVEDDIATLVQIAQQQQERH
jgi:hypothetical protein